MKKRILLISDVEGWGGWVRGQYIKKHLSDEFDFTLIDANEFKKIECSSNKDLFSLNDINDFKKKNVDKEHFNIYEFTEFLNKRKTEPFDLYYLLFHTMLIKKSTARLFDRGGKVVTIVTGFPTVKPCFLRGGGNGVQRFRNVSKKCKAIFSNNIMALNDLNIVKSEGMPTYYCPRGVDENMFYPEGDKQKKFTVVYVGKPVKEKGLLDFIKPACQTVGAELIINDRNFTNALGPNEMRRLYNKADVYIVASTIDGTPNPALEAAACGVPIISNRIGNMPEFIENGKNGFLVDLDINKYTNKLRWMMNSPIKRLKMGKAARDTILSNWTWKKVLENERKIFKEILK